MGTFIDQPDRQLPSGTVTFLFTDIEGSAALAQNYPDEMTSLLAKHHTILRQSIEAHKGYIFQITGDAFASAFHTVSEAIDAALEAQRRLLHEDWRPTPVKVRMGIHTGAAQAGGLEDRAGGYGGYLTLTRVQRIMSVAHGGQVLLSSASAELARGQLPHQVTLRDMGEHRLKGLVNPERVWQVLAPDLPAEFPPLQSLNIISSNLPAQPTALIGREAELSEIVKRLDTEGVRLLTLFGPGGIGKTRLAIQASAELLDRFKDGVFFVDLAPIRDPVAFPAAITQALGLRETSDRPRLQELKEQLRARQMLLLLDNFEQVTAAALQVAELLRECPQLKLLVTSREALHVRGEFVFPVPPLALPRNDRKGLLIEQLTQYEAVRLFIERAQAVRPDFNVTNENAPAVAEICWRLDGLPLAIELAAARIRLLSPQALLDKLGNRLNLLRGGARDLPVRQQTLRSAIDWSYELLEPGEQRLFELLAVFQGCTFEALDGVVGGIEPLHDTGMDLLDGLASLVDKSLIRQVDYKDGESLFLMLETIREYALERLEEHPEFSAAARQAHAVYYADFTKRQWERLIGHEREASLAAMEFNLENLRVAWRYWADKMNLEQLGKLTDSLWLLNEARGWYHATIDLSTDLLEILSRVPPTPENAKEEIVLRTSLARALMATKGYTPEVEEAFTQALELCQRAGEIPQLFSVLRGLASFYVLQGNLEKGTQLGKQILSLADSYYDANMRVEAYLVLGGSANNPVRGLDYLEKGIQNFDPDRQPPRRFRLGPNPGVTCLSVSALYLWMLGFPDRALERSNEAIILAKRLDHPYSLAYALFHKGMLHLWRREATAAQKCAQAVLDIAGVHEFKIWNTSGTCLNGAALAGLGQVESGLAQLNAGMDTYQEMKNPPIFRLILLSMRARMNGLAGKPEEGLIWLNQAMQIVGSNTDFTLFVDLCNIKGDLLLAISPDNFAEAEALYQQALEISLKSQTPMSELHSAMRLCRLWMETGRAEQGKRVLRNAYQKFTEGFTTADLMEAKELLQ